MSGALFILGIVAAISGIISGITTGSLLGFFTTATNGIFIAIILLAISKLLENQDIIMHKLNILEKSTIDISKITCSNCSNIYDSDISSCPNCGHKE